MRHAQVERMRDSLTRSLAGASGAVIVIGVALAAAPAVAQPVNAQPSIFGVQGGLVQTAAEANNDIGASGIVGMFLRRGFSHRWALQFDVSRVRHDDWGIISSTASVMHAFGASRRLVPMIRGGVGFDVATGSYHDGAAHAEAAAVLELRLDSGLVIGGDLSIGARSSPVVPCSYDGFYPRVSPDACEGPSVFRSTYRAAKLTLAMAF
jgi:hypothetical protein